MTAKEIAKKYVYGNHDALTDKQEVIDMVKDIEQLVTYKLNKNGKFSANKIEEVLKEVKSERFRQNKKWGEQNHKPIEWIAILGEEFGEVSKEALEYHFKHPVLDTEGEKAIEMVQDIAQKSRLKNYRMELIQVAAVAVQMVESLDRNELK